MAMFIREAFREISISVWDNIAHKKRQERKPAEEALTDRVMDRLFDIPGRALKTVEFKKSEEGKNGADWEWVFLGRDGSNFTVRVQAKVIDPFVMQYNELHYKQKKSDRYQSDLLIERAKASNALPIYCLYTHADGLDTKKMWRCACTMNVKVYGCSLVPAPVVKALRRSNKKSFSDLQPHLLPMHCAVSCNSDPTLSLPERVSRYWQSVMAHQTRFSMSRSDRPFSNGEFLYEHVSVIPKIQDTPARHVEAILQEKADTVDFDDLGLRAVTVFFEENSETER